MNLAGTRIGVAIPAYQAVRTVGDVAARALRIVPITLVVDDGSTDGTGDAARRAGAEVIAHPVNRGKGRALETAFRNLFARDCEAVVTVDADGQHLPEEIPKLLEPLAAGADLVLGSRHHRFAEMTPLRRFSNGGSSWAISRVAGVALPDVQTGFRLYSRRLFETVGFPESGFAAESAVVVRAARAGLTIVAIPVTIGAANGIATSHYRPLVDGLRIARAVVLARLERRDPAAPRNLT